MNSPPNSRREGSGKVTSFTSSPMSRRMSNSGIWSNPAVNHIMVRSRAVLGMRYRPKGLDQRLPRARARAREKRNTGSSSVMARTVL